ncbi:MAG: GIDE domain-containing protein [Omnitrophica WOR_2 bacterium]
MDTIYILLTLAIAVVVGILLSIPDILNMINLRRTPTIWMNALPRSGRVEVTGKVDCSPIESPVKNVPCVFWEMEIQEAKKGKNGVTWSTVLSKRSDEPFVLNDETGKVSVFPAGARVILENESCDDLENLPVTVRNFIVRSGLHMKTLWGADKHFRVIERTISPDQELYVRGKAEERSGQIVITTGDRGVISDSGEESIRSLYIKRILTRLGVPIIVAFGIIIYSFIK